MISGRAVAAMVAGRARALPNVLRCNRCQRLFSPKGIQIKEKKEGQYQIQWFACPLCGKRYLINCTDQEQRRRIERRMVIIQKIRAGIKKRFRQKTINRYRLELERLDKEIKGQAVKLNEMGRNWMEAPDNLKSEVFANHQEAKHETQ